MIPAILRRRHKKTLHGYFMLPSEPSHTQRKARTLCRLELPPSHLAFPGQARITCPACLERTRALRVQWAEVKEQSVRLGIQSRQAEEATLALHRIDLLLPP